MLRLWFRIPPGAWMSVCRECCVLSGRGLCVGLFTRPDESYRLCWVVVCDLEPSRMGRPLPTGGCCAKKDARFGSNYSGRALTYLHASEVFSSTQISSTDFIQIRRTSCLLPATRAYPHSSEMLTSLFLIRDVTAKWRRNTPPLRI